MVCNMGRTAMGILSVLVTPYFLSSFGKSIKSNSVMTTCGPTGVLEDMLWNLHIERHKVGAGSGPCRSAWSNR